MSGTVVVFVICINVLCDIKKMILFLKILLITLDEKKTYVCMLI